MGAQQPPSYGRGQLRRRFAAAGLTAAALLAALFGCVASQPEITGAARPAITPDQVRIYLRPPESKYEEIANLTASSRGSFALTAAGKTDKVIERLKRQAARLGANGLLLHGVADQGEASLGAGVSTETNSPHSPYGLGFGGSAFFYEKAGDGIAIYVESGTSAMPK